MAGSTPPGGGSDQHYNGYRPPAWSPSVIFVPSMMSRREEYWYYDNPLMELPLVVDGRRRAGAIPKLFTLPMSRVAEPHPTVEEEHAPPGCLPPSRVPFVDDGGEVPNSLGGFEIGDELGAGRYGRVFSAVNPTDGRSEAVKAITKSKVIGEIEFQKVRNEHDILSSIRPHRNYIGLTQAFQSEEFIYFFMTRARGGELFDFMRQFSRQRMEVDNGTLAHLFVGISSGLACLHEQGVCHRDLKPENIVVEEDYNTVIVDFGSACRRFELNEQCVGSMPFIAPESLKENATDGAPGDVWALGIIMLELLFGSKRKLSKAIGWEAQDMTREECADLVTRRWIDPAAGLAYVRLCMGSTREFEGQEQLITILDANPSRRPEAQNLQDADWLQPVRQI